MPRRNAVAIENNFRNGLITEATALNFPQNAVTETYNCVFDADGSVRRRAGFDFEPNYSTKNINRANGVVNAYLWENVAGNGDLTVVVVQVGATIYFYKTSTSGTYSSGAISDTVPLTAVSGATSVETIEAQFSDGNGYLFITHRHCEPMRVAYNTASDTVTETAITLQVRDFEGAVADPLTVTERPTSTLAGLNVSHRYNLQNQGWSAGNLANWDAAQTTMPSNADVMWRFKNSLDNYDFTSSVIDRVTAGNTPAPKGFYKLTLSSGDRDTASGLSGVAATSTGIYRPSTSAFFAGRVFYSGIQTAGFNSSIFFTQIIERDEQYGQCFQRNDPTSEDLFDLLPTDGGVISIDEAGTIYKLFAVPGGLCVFAANGVWFITGSQGLGFTATDYSIQKLSNVSTLTASSFVNVRGYPCWWNTDGIYIMSVQGNGFPVVQSLTDNKIEGFFDEIPLASKRNAKGFFDPIEGRISWIYKTESTNQATEAYEYDRVLHFNVNTGAFYPWTISESDVKVNAIVPFDLGAKSSVLVNVIDGSSNNVIDASTNQVIAFTATGAEELPLSKFLVSYVNGSTYTFTFADVSNTDYLDWYTYDTAGEDYESYFVSGYKLPGAGIAKFQNNWVQVFSRLNDLSSSYYYQGVWDFANTGSGTGKWSTRQYVTHTDTSYDVDFRRLKVRGHGVAQQFKVTSVDGEPFDIIGWTSAQGVNQAP